MINPELQNENYLGYVVKSDICKVLSYKMLLGLL